jgi:2-oxoglutarate ferredoxin oxidoreductase subunit gamma
MVKTEVKISGFGGQGVILSAHILGKAASIFDGKQATMTQAFGPEARGSSCSAQVILSDEIIRYPYLKAPEVLVSMSQEAFTRFSPEVAKGGMVLIDEDLVKPSDKKRDFAIYSIPATRFAEELGRKLVLNIVMFGFFTAMTGLVQKESALKAVLDSVPKGTEDLNTNAFNKGYDYGAKLREESPGLAKTNKKAPAKKKAAAKK